MLEGVTECYRVLQSITECYRVLQGVSSASTWTNFWACFYESVPQFFLIFLASFRHLLTPAVSAPWALSTWTQGDQLVIKGSRLQVLRTSGFLLFSKINHPFHFNWSAANPDMRFVYNFTPPDFQTKNFTPLISPNFNSFSDKITKKWVKMAKILHCRRQWRHG